MNNAKSLIAICLFLFCVSAFGANPDYKSFRGAGGITVVTNPPNGTIVIDGSGVMATGTNSSIGTYTNGVAVSMAATNNNFTAGTNLVLRGTNIGSTAHISYELAPDVSIPGSLTVGAEALFNNIATFNGTVSINQGATNGFVLTTDAGGNATWRPPTGGGTNIGVGQTLYLDAAFGNDATAQRTNLNRTYLTASNATAAILSGDTLRVRGGTYLINPKADPVGFPGVNSSGGVTISNRNNFRITGEPGAIWKMAAQTTVGSTSSCPMLVIAGCTNFVIENMTFVGIRTNARVSQDFAIMLDRCANWTIRNCIISNWQNQGVTDGGLADGLQGTCNQNVLIENSIFMNCGGTNQAGLGYDGAAISVNASNMTVKGCTFVNNLRDIEVYQNGNVRGLQIVNNCMYGNYYQSLVLEAATVCEVQIVGNRAYGYSTTLPFNVTESTFLHTRGMSNVLVTDNLMNGMSGVIWSEAADISDVKILGNEIADVVYWPVFIKQSVGAAGRVNRLTVRGNKIRNTVGGAIKVTGNDTVIADNEFWNCNAFRFSTEGRAGVIASGSEFANDATNATNVVITGNKIFNSDTNAGAYSRATGIVVFATAISNVVWGNSVDRKFYIQDIHDRGLGTRTRPVNLIAAGKILATDGGQDETGLTVGPNLVNTGGVLSVNTNPTFNVVTANNFGNSLLVLMSNICATVVTVSEGANATIVTNSVPGHTDYNISVTGGGGGGSVQTNANQFAANPVLTLKSGVNLTNPIVNGELEWRTYSATQMGFSNNNAGLLSFYTDIANNAWNFDDDLFVGARMSSSTLTVSNMPGVGEIVAITTAGLTMRTNTLNVSNINASIIYATNFQTSIPDGYVAWSSNGFLVGEAALQWDRSDDTLTATSVVAQAIGVIKGVGFGKVLTDSLGTGYATWQYPERAYSFILSNAATYQVDFSNGTNGAFSTDVMRANLTLQLTNWTLGASKSFFLTGDTNANDRTVTLSTNGVPALTAVRWNFNSPTNGSSDFTVTNNMRAELSLKCVTNQVGRMEVWAVWGAVR